MGKSEESDMEEKLDKMDRDNGVYDDEECPCGEAKCRSDCEVCQDLPAGTFEYWENLRRFNRRRDAEEKKGSCGLKNCGQHPKGETP
jgi:hypothetical protein